MYFVTILAFCQVGMPQPPVEDRIPFAANYTLTEVLQAKQLVRDSSEFLKQRCNLDDINQVKKLFKQLREQGVVEEIYTHLGSVVSPTATDRGVRASLVHLKQVLSEKDYKAGKVPPPIPEEYRKEFEAWRAKIIEDDKNGKRPKD
jgi:hypothetical protein